MRLHVMPLAAIIGLATIGGAPLASAQEQHPMPQSLRVEHDEIIEDLAWVAHQQPQLAEPAP